MIIPVGLVGQVSYSGHLNPYNLYRISNGTEISLPFRMAEANVVYAWESGDLRGSLAWETRWSSSRRKSRLDVREVYLSIYPSFGEIRLGKQIHAWGAVDGNNPTDNLSGYDYYYLFFPGAARKMGSLSLSVTAYAGDWKIQGAFIPDHGPNRLPFNEPDFPISLPPEPGEDLWGEMSNPREYGFRLTRSLRIGDASLSYFKGRDRVFNVVGVTYGYPGVPIPGFGYRKSEVMGVDWVTFVGSLTVRGEAGYFRTLNDYDADQFHVKLETDASYTQYVLEVEYPGPRDVNLMGQFIGQTVLSVEGETVNPVTGQRESLTRENFQPGLGTPFALFVDRAILVVADASAMDGRLEFSVMSLLDVEEAGTMWGWSLEYSPLENWKLEGGATLFRGEDANIFQDLKDFSHLRLGVKYSF